MSDCPEIDLVKAKSHLDAGDSIFIDIRDPESYASGHIPGAKRIDNENVQAFVDDTPKDARIIVCCYHGNSSKGGTRFLLGQGFASVFSLRGGFEAWRHEHPTETGAQD